MILPSYMIIYDRVSIYKPNYVYSKVTGDLLNSSTSVLPVTNVSPIDPYKKENKDSDTLLDEQINNQQYFFFLQSLKTKKEAG